MARTTNFFGDIVENIYDNFEKNAADVVDSVHAELVKASPYYSGTLSSNWKKGIRPNSKGDNINPNIKKGPWRRGIYPRASTSLVKTYGIHHRYYIWNNTPYLPYVNSGINPLYPDRGRNYIGFVGKAIELGIKMAQNKATIKAQPFY